MGREQKRKQAKREGRNVKEVQQKKQEASTLKPKSFLIILGIVVVFFTILYLITGLFITKDLKSDKKDKETTDEQQEIASDNKILAIDTLKQSEEEYYVYYYDTTDENEEITNLTYSLDKTVYKVDLHDDFNSNYVGESSGIVDKIEDLKVSAPTIIKVSSNKIIEYYNGIDEIKSKLNQ